MRHFRSYILTIIYLLLTASGCTSKEVGYTNSSTYQLHVGQTVEIYYSTSSCCYYCIVNEKSLSHVQFINRKAVEEHKKPEDMSKMCVGCPSTFAFVFKAIKPGIDTIRLDRPMALESCDSTYSKDQELYIVEVK
ncbi:hypothetical protein QNI16_11135 [Cytophagaceae bacterium YF14B1]|uniref:Lipoprotein n=1 Tax=Xanthocytophaga flava TaxID=3048013 RepID=A0AAE3U8C1_9BACT|nr:hypothetical protein [Xanthocytophaga flavus]MDJ1481038.1 hypothetical protein [Xanthocytophaga flavus]